MNANDINNTMLRNHIAEIFNDANNNCNPQCNRCRMLCEGFIMETAHCILTEGENNVVKVEHLCQNESTRPNTIHVCLGCLRYHGRRDMLTCACAKATATSAVAAPPEDENQGSHQQSVHYDDCNDGFDDDQDYCFTDQSQRVITEGKIEANFKDETAFNQKSSNYFRNEHKEPDSGKKCLVENALDKKVHTIDEVNMALLTTHLHFNTTKDQSRDILQVNHQTVKRLEEEKREDKEMLDKFLEESISESLSKMISEMNIGASSNGSDDLSVKMLSNVSDLTKNITNSTEQKMDNAKRQNILQSNDPPDFKAIRNKYLKGNKSIVKNLPIPNVEMAHGFAYVPLEQTVNLLLAMGLPLRHYKDDSHWKDEYGKYEGEYFKSLHEKIKSDVCYADTRSYIARGWSDGFSLHYVKIDSEYNNLQLYTVTLLGEKGQPDHTWPFAIGFKQSDHSKILNMFLAQAKALATPKLRYIGGSERKLVLVSIHLQVMMNDYIERVANCFLSQNGKFAHRWGYSCAYCEKTTPSCKSCRGKRIDRVLAGTADAPSDSPSGCDHCTDWWSLSIPTEKLTRYPLRIEEVKSIRQMEQTGNLKMMPAVKLNFEMLRNCVLEVKEHWDKVSKETNKPPTKVDVKYYFDICGIQPKLSEKMIDELIHGDGKIEEMIPEIWKDIIGSGLDLFVQLPMHLCALGIEKTLIKNTKSFLNMGFSLKSGKDKMVPEVQEVHNRINSASIDWLDSQPFTSKDDLTTSNWQSDSFFAFTRTSLVLFGVLAEDEDCEGAIGVPNHQEAFQEVRVLWFCLMSNMFADEQVSSHTIDDYSKLFLDACVRLHKATFNSKQKNQREKKANSKQKKVKTQPKRKKANSTKRKKADSNLTQKNQRQKKAFFEEKCNFFSILNTKQVVDRHSSSRALWEGGDSGEKFIQKYKGANTKGFFRHNNRFMVTFTEKVMNNYMLDHINKDNPMRYRDHYVRALNFTVYGIASPLTLGIVVSGVLVNDKMYVCFNGQQTSSSGKNQVVLKELTFDDKAGQWHYNLFYAPATIDHNKEVICEDREEVVERSSDVFALFHLGLLPDEVESEKICFTMICRSWRIRDDAGKLRLPTPQKKLLRRGHLGVGDEDGSSELGIEYTDDNEQSNASIDEEGNGSKQASKKKRKLTNSSK